MRMIHVKLTPVYPRIFEDPTKIKDHITGEDVFVEVPFLGLKFWIRKGYPFDGHSSPKWLRWLFPRCKGIDIICALVHDYLTEQFHAWKNAVKAGVEYTGIKIERWPCDQIYTSMMYSATYQTNWFRTRFMTKGVRVFGFLVYTIWTLLGKLIKKYVEV